MADSSRKSPVVPPDVRELIEESQKIQGWVERLAEHVDEARPEVYRRVLSDYEGRLEKITARLVKHRADLVSNLEDHEIRLTSLEGDRDTHAAELEEVRLRHAVGEYSADEWDERRGGIEDAISEIDGRLAVEQEAVAELSAIIASIGEGGTPAIGDHAAPTAKGVEALKAEAAVAKTAPVETGQDEAEHEPAAEAPDAAVSSEPAKASDKAPEGASAAKGSPSADSAPAKRPAAAKHPAAEKGAAAKKKPVRPADDEEEAPSGEYLDELEFLESLSLDEAERFDAVSAMLDEDESGNGKKEG